MANTYKNLGQSQIANTTTTVYTVPGSTTGIIKELIITNTTSSAATITVYADPDGTVADATTAILSGWSVPANDFLRFRCWLPMTAASTLKAVGGTNNAITITVSGVEY